MGWEQDRDNTGMGRRLFLGCHWCHHSPVFPIPPCFSPRWGRGGTVPMSPVSPPADVHNLWIRCSVNGQRMQDSSTRHLIFGVPALVAWVSR